jgi:hypothetical protein
MYPLGTMSLSQNLFSRKRVVYLPVTMFSDTEGLYASIRDYEVFCENFMVLGGFKGQIGIPSIMVVCLW